MSQIFPLSPFIQWKVPFPLSSNYSFPHCVIMGPLEGIMGDVFCQTAAQLNLVDAWMTPFIRISTAVPRESRLRSMVSRYVQTKRPVVVQLLGNHPERLAESAKRLLGIGINGINLNFACPSREVIGSNCGGALLKNPLLMCQIIEKMGKECPDCAISVKLRSGFYKSDEIISIIPALENAGAKVLIVHFRTVQEGYQQIENRTKRIREMTKYSHIPFIASGDIFEQNDLLEYAQKTSVSGVAIARGLIRTPYLMRDVINHMFPENTNPIPHYPLATYWFTLMQNCLPLTSEKAKKAVLMENFAMNPWSRKILCPLLCKSNAVDDFIKNWSLSKLQALEESFIS